MLTDASVADIAADFSSEIQRSITTCLLPSEAGLAVDIVVHGLGRDLLPRTTGWHRRLRDCALCVTRASRLRVINRVGV